MYKKILAIAIIGVLLAVMLPTTEGVPIETKEFSDINEFYLDGYLSHYYVELYDPGLTGEVYLYHPEDTYDFTVQTTNIKVLIVDVQSLYDDEAGDVWVSLPADFRAWIISHISYNITLSGDGYLETVGINNGETLQPEGITWNDGEINFTNPVPGTFMVQLPDHGIEDNTIIVFYDMEFGSPLFYNSLYRSAFYMFLIVPVLVGAVLTFKKKLWNKSK